MGNVDSDLETASSELRKFAEGKRSMTDETPLDLFLTGNDEFIQNIVKPLWKRQAMVLSDGGYPTLLTELERIRSRRTAAHDFVSLWQNGASYAGAIYHILLQKAELHSRDARLLIISDEPSVNGEVWSILESGDDTQTTKFVSVLIPQEVRPRLNLPTKDEEYSPIGLSYQFRATSSFGDALAATETKKKRLVRIADSKRGLLEVLNFRENLLSTAIFLYEAYGHVSPKRPALNIGQVILFIDGAGESRDAALALAAIGLELYENESMAIHNRSQLTEKMAAEGFHDDERRVQEFLERHGLYITKEGRGRPTSQHEKLLLHDLISLWRAALGEIE